MYRLSSANDQVLSLVTIKLNSLSFASRLLVVFTVELTHTVVVAVQVDSRELVGKFLKNCMSEER
jgi:hypothetical protein